MNIKHGQIWQLGCQRLACGDCFDDKLIKQLLDGADIDCIIYDPPWHIKSAMQKPKIVENVDNLLAFTDGMYAKKVIGLFGSPSWIFGWDCCTNWRVNKQLPFKQQKLCFWYGDLKSYNVNGAYYGQGDADKNQFYNPQNRGKHLSDLYREPIIKLHQDHQHNHTKPLNWIRMLIGNCSSGEVLDLFGGSGSTLIACEQLQRFSYTVEIEPEFCADIIKRWQDFTCKQAFLINPTQ